jgi:predicted MFS family arabinose efflux permease
MTGETASSPGAVPAGRAERAERAKWAVAAVFFEVGFVLSAWFTQIPQFKARIGLTDGTLGLALLCPAAGALISMQVAGRLARRHGSANLVRVATVALAVAAALVAAVGNFAALVGALLVFGAADGMSDVSMNAHAVAVEHALGRPILQRMHAAFSLGTIAGAVSGGVAIWAKVTPLGYLTGVAVCAAAVAAAVATGLLPSAADRGQQTDPADAQPQRARRRFAAAGWSPFVIVLGLLGAGCLMAEGAAESWGAVFLRDQRHAAAAVASAAYLAFTAVQLAGRLVGDRLHARWGSVQLVRRGATVAAVGLAIQLTVPQQAVAVIGICIYSLGLSVLVPIVFGAVGHGSAAESGSESVTAAVAQFTTLSYLGYLLGPASIGWLAQGVGLTWALAAVLAVLGAVFGFARWTGSALPGTPAAEAAPLPGPGALAGEATAS